MNPGRETVRAVVSCFGHFKKQDENKSRCFPEKLYTTSDFPISTFSSLTCLNDETRARWRGIGVGAGTSRVSAETMFIRASVVAATTAVSSADNIRSDERRKLEKRQRPAVGTPRGASWRKNEDSSRRNRFHTEECRPM